MEDNAVREPRQDQLTLIPLKLGGCEGVSSETLKSVLHGLEKDTAKTVRLTLVEV